MKNKTMKDILIFIFVLALIFLPLRILLHVVYNDMSSNYLDNLSFAIDVFAWTTIVFAWTTIVGSFYVVYLEEEK